MGLKGRLRHIYTATETAALPGTLLLLGVLLVAVGALERGLDNL